MTTTKDLELRENIGEVENAETTFGIVEQFI